MNTPRMYINVYKLCGNSICEYIYHKLCLYLVANSNSYSIFLGVPDEPWRGDHYRRRLLYTVWDAGLAGMACVYSKVLYVYSV